MTALSWHEVISTGRLGSGCAPRVRMRRVSLAGSAKPPMKTGAARSYLLVKDVRFPFLRDRWKDRPRWPGSVNCLRCLMRLWIAWLDSFQHCAGFLLGRLAQQRSGKHSAVTDPKCPTVELTHFIDRKCFAVQFDFSDSRGAHKVVALTPAGKHCGKRCQVPPRPEI